MSLKIIRFPVNQGSGHCLDCAWVYAPLEEQDLTGDN
jgi:hypothetical protein